MAGRDTAFAQDAAPTVVDRFGRWLSWRKLPDAANVAGLCVADVGCGHDAPFASRVMDSAASVHLFDVALDPRIADHPNAHFHPGELPSTLDVLASNSVDVIVCNNALEHLWDDQLALDEMHRALVPSGVLYVNVPSWRGKAILEFSAFRMGTSPASEMNDHKTYYDPRDLWPRLVRAGFRPQDITCRRHKGGLNTLARCIKSARDS